MMKFAESMQKNVHHVQSLVYNTLDALSHAYNPYHLVEIVRNAFTFLSVSQSVSITYCTNIAIFPY